MTARPARNLKVFAAYATMVPTEWKRVVNPETSHHQADVVIVAATKAQAIEMLTAAGTDRVDAETIVRASRQAMATSAVEALMDAGIVDLKQPVAVVYRRSVKGQPIARVDVEGLPVVGTWQYRRPSDAAERGDSYGLYVEAAK